MNPWIPPPTPQAIAQAWLEQFAAKWHLKATLKMEERNGDYEVIKLDRHHTTGGLPK